MWSRFFTASEDLSPSTSPSPSSAPNPITKTRFSTFFPRRAASYADTKPADSVARLLRCLYQTVRRWNVSSLLLLLVAGWAGCVACRHLRHSGRRVGPSTASRERGAPNPQSNGKVKAEEEEEDIDFVDAAESAFRVFQQRVEESHRVPLLHALDAMDAMGAQWQQQTESHGDSKPLKATGGHHTPHTNGTAKEEDGEEERTRHLLRRLQRKVMEADERLTQLIVQLDLTPVSDSAELRLERKKSIAAASALAERIAKWTHLLPKQE